MAITFEPMRKLMRERGVSYYFLANQGIDNRTLHRLRHDMPVTTNTLGKLCRILNCRPEQLIDYRDDA